MDRVQHLHGKNTKLQEKARWSALRIIQEAGEVGDPLEEKAEKTKTNYSKRKMDEITKTTYAAAMSGDLIQDRNDLTRRITDIITNPNQKWKRAKVDYEIPRDYFS